MTKILVIDDDLAINELIKTVENKYNKIDRETEYLKTKTGKDIYLQKKKKLKEYIDNFKMEISEYKIYK